MHLPEDLDRMEGDQPLVDGITRPTNAPLGAQYPGPMRGLG